MKSREHIVNNGKAVFYACIWPDIRDKALDHGWALGLHGSLSNDMDIMAMPWTEDAVPAREMIEALCECFTDHKELSESISISNNKPNNRTVYTIPIWADFYLDINIIQV